MSYQNIRKDSNISNLKVQQEITEKVQLLFVGAPLLDISAKCDEETRKLYGLERDDCVLANKEHDPLFEQIFRRQDSRLLAGGSAQNAARIAKWILGIKGEVAFAGCTGCDDFEKWMRNKLFSEGVLPLYVKLPEANTGVCACLLSEENERSMCCRQGAAALFSTEHLRSDLMHSFLIRSQCIFIEGYFIVHSPDVVHFLAEHHSSSQIFSLSLSAEYVCRSHCEALAKVIPKVDVLFGNEAEVLTLAQSMSGKSDLSIHESVKMLRCLQTSETSQSRILIVTRGSKPLMAVYGSDEYHAFEIKPVRAIADSVGCGDALSGAFLAHYISSRDIDSSIKIGIEAARQILQVSGCDPPQTLDERSFGRTYSTEILL